MKITCYRMTKDLFLQEIPFQGFGPPRPGQEGVRWVHAEDMTPEDCDTLLAPLNLHPLIVERWNEPGRNARLAAFGKVFHLDLPTSLQNVHQRAPYLSIIVTPDLVLTMAFQPIAALSEITRERSADTPFLTDSVAALLYAIIDEMVERNMLHVLDIRDQADALANAFLEGPGDPDLNDILLLKRQVSRLSALCEDLLHSVSSIQTTESAGFAIEGHRDYFRDLISHLEKALQILDRQEARLKDLRQHYDLTLHGRTEKRLRLLTILSATFLPMFLLTGVYGMNFEHMPELGVRYAYPLVIGLMVTIAAAMLLYFRKSGWFN